MLYWAIRTCKVTLSLTVRRSASGTNGAVMQQITDWLQKLGLEQYAQRFAENDIEIDVLSELTDQDFDRPGVSLGQPQAMWESETFVKCDPALCRCAGIYGTGRCSSRPFGLKCRYENQVRGFSTPANAGRAGV
jgi:SAM domain (Sterile alpha motif)